MFSYQRFLLFLFLLPVLLSSAQQYNYRHYGEKEGLPSNTVYSILQDHKGFIWFSTDAGVCRFDGYSFKTFTVKDGLPDNDVLYITEDSRGRIWCNVYKRGLAYIENDSVHVFNPKDIFKQTILYNVTDSKDGALWIATGSKGVIRYKDGNIETFGKANNKLPYDITTVTKDRNDRIWIGSAFGYSSADNMQQYHRLPDSLFLKGDLVHLFFPASGLMYGYSKSHFFHITNDSVTSLFSSQIAGEEIFILSVHEDANGNFLLGTSGGAFRVFAGTGRVEVLRAMQPINHVFEDNEHNLWFTTTSEGMYFISKGALEVKNYTLGQSTTVNAFRTIIPDTAAGRIYLSSLTGALYEFKNDSLHAIPKPDYNRYSNIYNCLSDASNNILCGGDFGIVIFHHGDVWGHQKKAFKSNAAFYKNEKYATPLDINDSYSVIQAPSVKEIIWGKKNEIWAATTYGLFHIMLTAEGSKLEQLTYQRLSAICQDKEGKIWVGGMEGLGYYNGDSIIFVSGKEPALKGNINYIEIDNEGYLWIATSGYGLYSYKNGLVQQITTRDGLSSDIINSLVKRPGHLLLATKRGINKVILAGKGKVAAAYPLQINEGLINTEVKNIYCSGGKVYSVSTNGLSVFDEGSVSKDTSSPLVYLTRLQINEADTSLNPRYELSYDQNYLKIEYVALQYKSDRNIVYRYRMEGLDTAWTETPYINVQYPTLPPGKYRFIVDARSVQSNWSGKPATFEVVIRPPFWQTWWFRIVMALLVMGIVVGVSFAVIRYYRNRNEIARRMVLLEGQALRAQMNPHFIFNSLNAIHDFIADQDQRSAHLYLSKFAALIRRILELSRKQEVALSEEVETLNLYIELENLRFENKFDYKVRVDTKDDPFDLVIPPMLLQPYVENAIRHGLQNKGDKGRLQVDIEQQNGLLLCRITDNGIGRKAAALGGKNITRHRSHGLDITSERINIFNDKEQSVRSEVKITDLEDADGNALGTMVELNIPLKKNYSK